MLLLAKVLSALIEKQTKKRCLNANIARERSMPRIPVGADDGSNDATIPSTRKQKDGTMLDWFRFLIFLSVSWLYNAYIGITYYITLFFFYMQQIFMSWLILQSIARKSWLLNDLSNTWLGSAVFMFSIRLILLDCLFTTPLERILTEQCFVNHLQIQTLYCSNISNWRWKRVFCVKNLIPGLIRQSKKFSTNLLM